MEDFDIESLVGNILGTSAPVAPPSTVAQSAIPPAPVAATPVAIPPATPVVVAPVITTSRIPMPTFTSVDMMETLDPANFGTLVRLNTRRWHAKKKDPTAARNAANASGATTEAYEAKKRLLVGVDGPLRAVHSIIDSARTKHYEMTSPWSMQSVDDMGRRTGARMLPNTLFFDYTQVMAQNKADMDAALAEFVAQYPALIQQVQQNLGTAFDPNDYPLPSEIEHHFDLSFEFSPIPAGNGFKGLPQQQLDQLARKLNESTMTMVENAMADMWSQLYTAVAKMHERLSDPDKKFHYTLVDNIREAVQYVGHLNVLNDSRVEEIRSLVHQHLCNDAVEVLRDNATVRSKVAAHAGDILKRMQSFDKMGVK